MNTHDIELPPLPKASKMYDIPGYDEEELKDYARAAIEADRQLRSGSVASPAQPDDFDAQQRRIEKSMRAGARLTDHRFKLDATQPAEPLKSRRIDEALRGLQASVAVGSDGAWVSIRREARDAAVKLLQELNTGSQGSAHSASSYSGCGCNSDDCRVNGCLMKRQAQSAMAPGGGGMPAEPVKSHLKVSYDDKGDCLYVVCDSNEPAVAEEDDKGILYRRAISDGRLVGVTIMNLMGRHEEPSDDVPQPAEPVKSLIDNQEPLGEEFQRVLDEHSWDLYVKTTEPVNKTDWSAELSSWSDEDFIQVFHERPDLANRLRKMLAEPVKVPSDADILFTMRHLERHLKCIDDAIPTLLSTARALLARYGKPSEPKRDSAGNTLGPVSDGGLDPRNAPASPEQKPSVEALAETADGWSPDRKELASKVLERQTLKHQGYQPIQSGPLPPPPPSEPVKVPPGYVLIAEDHLEAMIGPERMDHLRRSCRFPAP